MNPAPFIHQWLSGPFGGKTMLLLRAVFFLMFLLAAGRLALARSGTPRGGKGRNPFHLLRLGTMIALFAILAYQTTWQLFGTRRVDFMRFLRRYNPRPSILVTRGAILDCNGRLLARDDPVPGDPWRRQYPLGSAAAHAVGYFSPRFGMAGMERAADLHLSGYAGDLRATLGNLGRNLVDTAPPEGADLRLTLDARLQHKAWELMRGKRGAVIVMRPTDGAVRVLLSMPSFDPTRPAAHQDDTANAPLLNRALQGLYPPGSTFKILMATLAAEQRYSPVFDCPAEGFRAAPDARPIRDSEYYSRARQGRTWEGWGRIGLRQAFVHSSNVYFAQLGLHGPAAPFNELATRIGLRERLLLYQSGDTRLASVPGKVPEVTDSDRRMRSQLAIGQGRMVLTPLHVARMTALVANGGRAVMPRLTPDDAPASPPQIIAPAAAALVRDLMREAVRDGTGRGADIPGMEVCGKTGTAQAPGGEDHAWFTCFAPSGKPQLVVTVLVERGGYGSRGALPVARDLLREAAVLGLLTPVPDRENAP